MSLATNCRPKRRATVASAALPSLDRPPRPAGSPRPKRLVTPREAPLETPPGVPQERAVADVGAPLRVWVIDDDPVVALYLGELLREHGFTVTTFGDPREAWRNYLDDPQCVDVVITDQRMPTLSGDALARAMLQLRPFMRLILCTGYSDRIDERRALAMGVQSFLRKPFDVRALLRAVRGERQ